MHKVSAKRLISGAIALLLCVGLVGSFACNGPRQFFSGRGESKAKSASFAGRFWQDKQFPAVSATIPIIAKAEFVKDDDLCMTCHESYAQHHKTNIHRDQSCETCHGPASQHIRSRGQEPGTILSFKKMTSPERSEVCMKCHQDDACSPGKKWRTSAHANAGVSCTDCHKSHYNVPPGTPSTKVAQAGESPAKVLPASFQERKKEAVDMTAIRAASRALGAADAQTCYKCHQQQAAMQGIAHPHQIGGPNNHNCQTCHDPHGNIKKETRTDTCLQCHKGHPAASWQSSVHSLHGVACTDCHNPHPRPEVARFADIRHTDVRRPKRLPMSVDEPDACYRCHSKTAAQFALPSHHPLREGKMMCSSCHDAHGFAEKNLKEPTVNLLCFKCHADKQGPFVWQHPPVEENCGICHNPHGAVANNLLHQPTTFLCLRCHSGHREFRRAPDKNTYMRQPFYTNCTICHSQIHGSDRPAATLTPRLTR